MLTAIRSLAFTLVFYSGSLFFVLAVGDGALWIATCDLLRCVPVARRGE